MDDVYIVVTRTDTVFDDSHREVSAIFKSYTDALNYLQKKYEEYSEEAKQFNEKYHNEVYEYGAWECFFEDDVVMSSGDMEDTTMKIISVKFGEEIDIWKLT